MQKEVIILSALLLNKDYASAVSPFLKEEYFHDADYLDCYKALSAHYAKYQAMPNRAALLYDMLALRARKPEDEERLKALCNEVFDVAITSNMAYDWLITHTENFCKEKAAYNVIFKAISVYDGSDNKTPASSIPDMMRDAVNISFDVSVGHDWLDDAQKRWEYYHSPESCIPFDLSSLNAITNDKGVARKTLNILLAGVGCGKTGMMCHLAAGYAKQGFNVLYITLEMQEELISKRIDANVLNIPMHELDRLHVADFLSKIDQIKLKSYGRIIVKEFPTASAHSGHFNHIITDLKAKRNIDVDVIFVDYIGICASSRVGLSGVNSYTYLKNVSEELRALAQMHDAALWTAVQLNRGGFESTDVEMTDIADSFGIAASADMILSLTRTEELDSVGQVLMKQIKNRYDNKTNKLRFTLGVDQAKQQYYDVESQPIEREQATTSMILGNNAANKIASKAEKFKAFK